MTGEFGSCAWVSFRNFQPFIHSILRIAVKLPVMELDFKVEKGLLRICICSFHSFI